eukprot:675712-Pelagomonas_calceolata.AAC.2
MMYGGGNWKSARRPWTSLLGICDVKQPPGDPPKAPRPYLFLTSYACRLIHGAFSASSQCTARMKKTVTHAATPLSFQEAQWQRPGPAAHLTHSAV